MDWEDDYPPAFAEAADPPPVNRFVSLHEGPMLLRAGPTVLEGTGSIELHLIPSPSVRWRLETGRGARRVGFQDVVIEAGATVAKGDVRSVGRGLAGHLDHAEPVETELTSLDFWILNGPEVHGAGITAAGRDWAGRCDLAIDDWVLLFDEVLDARERFAELVESGGIGVTHVGRLAKHDESDFSAGEAAAVLADLEMILSFARGAWVGVWVTKGVDRTGATWRRWSAPHVGPWRTPRSWLPRRADDDTIRELLASYRGRSQHTGWKSVLDHAIGWYADAAASNNCDTALISAFVALDMLSCRHLSSIDPAFNERAPAGVRIEALLRSLSIPTAVPARCAELAALANGSPGGPAILARLRNLIVHATPGNLEALSRIDGQARVDAMELGLQYLELGLLALLGYSGGIKDRTIEGWPDVSVPWSATQNG